MGTGKTGGHWKPCNIGSVEAHNERRPDYLESVKKAGLNLYFFQHLTNSNSHWVSSHDRYSGKTVAEVFDAMKKLYTEKTGQPPQLAEKTRKNKKTGKESKCAGWSPIREMCVPIKEDTKVEDFDYLKKWAEKYGIEIIRIDLHKDEGYHDKDTDEYKMNYHAHVVASFLNWNTGKTVKPNKEAMSEMQTVLAMALDMERGERKDDTGKLYLDHPQYRKMMEAGDEEKKKVKAVKAELANKQQQLDTINAELAKATKKLKGLTTMISNLEEKRADIELDISGLEELVKNGEGDIESNTKRLEELKGQVSALDAKLLDKRQKLRAAEQQLRDLDGQVQRLKDQKESLEKDIKAMIDEAIRRHDQTNKAIADKRAELKKMDKSGELARAQKHIEDRDAVIYRHWPEAREAVDTIFQLGSSNTATDFTPQQALHVEHAIVTSGTTREDAARDLVSLAKKDFDNSRTPDGWVKNATQEVMKIALGTHQKLTALLKQQPRDNSGGVSYITDLTDWAGNQIHR